MHEIEVFADVWCPFTHVGLWRFVAARAEGRVAGVLRVRAWPLELVNNQPLDPAFVAEEIDQIRSPVDADAFAGFDPDRFPRTTVPALLLTAVAYRSGPQVGEAVALELRHRCGAQFIENYLICTLLSNTCSLQWPRDASWGTPSGFGSVG